MPSSVSGGDHLLVKQNEEGSIPFGGALNGFSGRMESMVKDIYGDEIEIGNFVAYAVNNKGSSGMRFGRVVKITKRMGSTFFGAKVIQSITVERMHSRKWRNDLPKMKRFNIRSERAIIRLEKLPSGVVG